MTAIPPASPKLFAATIEDEHRIESIMNEVGSWDKGCALRLENIFRGGAYDSDDFGVPRKSERKQLRNYTNIANMVLFNLRRINEKHSLANGLKVSAAYDKYANLQSVAIYLFRESKKGTPFIHIAFLLTAFWNMPFNQPLNPNRLSGAGSALIAHAISLDKRSKIIYVEPVKWAVDFYRNKGFIPTRKHFVCFKLLKEEFDSFVKNHSVTICEEFMLPIDLNHFMEDMLLAAKRTEEENALNGKSGPSLFLSGLATPQREEGQE